MAAGAQRDAGQIETYPGTLGAALDVDGNHVADAQTDAVVILRRMFGATFVAGSRVDCGGAERTRPEAVTGYLNGFMPAAP